MKRGYFTPTERAAKLAEQCGTCCVPGCKETEGLIGEHTVPNALIAGKPDTLMCVAHHKEKTKDDIKRIAKAKRQKKYFETGKGYAPAKKKIKSQGFRPKPEGYKFSWSKRSFHNGKGK